MVAERSLWRSSDVNVTSLQGKKWLHFTSRRRLNNFKPTLDRRRQDVGPTKDDVALSSCRRRLVMWAIESVVNKTKEPVVNPTKSSDVNPTKELVGHQPRSLL